MINYIEVFKYSTKVWAGDEKQLNAFTSGCNFMVELFNREFSFDIMNVKTSILETGGSYEKTIHRGLDTQKFKELVNAEILI